MVCGALNGTDKKTLSIGCLRVFFLFSLGKKNLGCFRKKKTLKAWYFFGFKNFDYPKKNKKQFFCFLNRKSCGKTF